jgi:hypothetical protein
VVRCYMSESLISRPCRTRTYSSSDGRAHITVTPVKTEEDRVIVDLEVWLNPDTRDGAIPNKWSVSWINYADVIIEKFAPFVEKYCPEPEKLLTLFRESEMEHLSYITAVLKTG